jgi:pimeloyl-ACP methyl ester carboxylesterase
MMAEMWQEAAPAVTGDMLSSGDSYFDIDSSLSTTEQPTLILQADRDRGGVLTDQQAARAISLLPNGILTRVPGAGHAIHATNPAEFVNLVTDFAQIAPYATPLQ